MLASVKVGDGGFDDFGGQLKKLGQIAWNKPTQISDKITDSVKENSYSWKDAAKRAGESK